MDEKEMLSAGWRSPSNIALIKYWGKREGQIPANPSLSMTLSQAFTETRIMVSRTPEMSGIMSINGVKAHPFLLKLNLFYQWFLKEVPVFNGLTLQIQTRNSFPHSTGIASSASGFSAFTLCLLDLASKLTQVHLPEEHFFQLASYTSRMGSGSACRSLYSGYTVWGRTTLIDGSSDVFSVDINDRVNRTMEKLQDAILVVSSKPKSVASSLGHSRMNQHPFSGARVDQAHSHLAEALTALKQGDFEHLGSIAENEALTLHALIMTSRGGDILLDPKSLLLMQRIKQARAGGLPVFYTLDAGPNVHLMYPQSASASVRDFIQKELIPCCENNLVIYDHLGMGPQTLKN